MQILKVDQDKFFPMIKEANIIANEPSEKVGFAGQQLPVQKSTQLGFLLIKFIDAVQLINCLISN